MIKSQSVYPTFIKTNAESDSSGDGFFSEVGAAQVNKNLAVGQLSVTAVSSNVPAYASQAFAQPLFSSVSATAPAPSTATTVTASIATSTTTAGTTKSTASPAWVGTLKTASIAADMNAADANGTVSYSGLKTLLTDLDATLTSSKTSLTAAELSDLQTIAANLNNGMTTSAYLTSVMKAIANGNSENATWTGGAVASTSLGNLAVGSSATQLNELIGKWVLGTDLPSSKVSMSGASTFSVSYSASANPLFGASGPSMNDVNQGYLGDCYLLSCLAEVAKQNSGTISSMFSSNGNNTYGVRFYVNGTADYVTVNNALADGGSVFNAGTDIWASLAEKAYAQLQAGGVVTGNSVNSGNSWSTIGNGGAPEYALEEITGASAITDFRANGSSWYKIGYNASVSMTGYTSGNSTSSVLSMLASDLGKGDDVILSSMTNAIDSSGKQTLVADHAMSIYGYDSSTGMLEVRNPWGTMSGQYWDTTFEVGLGTLLADGDTITADNIGIGAATVALTAQTAAQTWKLGQSVSFTLASNIFTDSKSEKLTYAATQSSGVALPSWLSFNATSGTFSGTVPNTAAGLSIKVTATDLDGSSSSETFSVQTPAAAPVLSAQTANQNWATGKAVNFTLATNTFSDPQGETLTYSATQVGGTALPTWLKFNSATDSFTGTAPTAAGSLNLQVTATDTSGLSVSETFKATIAAAASQLTQAISSLSSGAASAGPDAIGLGDNADPRFAAALIGVRFQTRNSLGLSGPNNISLAMTACGTGPAQATPPIFTEALSGPVKFVNLTKTCLP